MTWKEFKDYVEREGVDDATEIEYIDVSTDILAGELTVVITPDDSTNGRPGTAGYIPERVRITN